MDVQLMDVDITTLTIENKYICIMYACMYVCQGLYMVNSHLSSGCKK